MVILSTSSRPTLRVAASEEPFEATACILMAEVEGCAVGTLRANLARETDQFNYPELFSMNVVGWAFTTGSFVVHEVRDHPGAPGRNAGAPDGVGFPELGRAHGIRFDFLDCNEHMKSCFTRLGNRRYMRLVENPESGRVLPRCIHLEDRNCLARNGSPLVQNHGWGGGFKVPIPSRPVDLAADRTRPFPEPLSVSWRPQLQSHAQTA